MVKNAVRLLFKTKFNIALFIVFTGVSLYLYYLAILNTGSIEIFLKETPVLLLIGQIVFSLLNSILIGIVLVMFIDVIKKRKKDTDLSFLGAIVALFFSVATTGCYVCGTILLPALGIAASFASLPLGGLEVKILTVLLLVYSLRQASKTYLGICDYDAGKKYRFSFGNFSILISAKRMNTLKSFAIVLGFIVLIFSLPIFIPDELKKEYSESNICVHEIQNRL